MARRTFFSFHYDADNWRAGQVRNMGVVEGNAPVSDNDWEEVKRGGDAAIEKWIDGQLNGRSCTIVLVGANTAGRKWINYEIRRSWNLGKGIVGIHVHNLLDKDGNQSQKGRNPFDLTIGDKKLSSIVKLYDPPYSTSTYVYDYIKQKIADWVEEAVRIRNNN
jgi:hypothetical protein